MKNSKGRPHPVLFQRFYYVESGIILSTCRTTSPGSTEPTGHTEEGKNNAVQLRVGSTLLPLLLGLQLISPTFLKFGILSSVTLEIQVLLDLLPGLLRSLFWLLKIFLDMLAVDPQILSVF